MAGDKWMWNEDICSGHECICDCDHCAWADKVIEAEQDDERSPSRDTLAIARREFDPRGLIKGIETVQNSKKESEKKEDERDLGDGLMDVCNELHDKLIDAAWRLELNPRTIINVDEYDVVVLLRALNELNDFMQRRKNKNAI